MNQNRLYVLYYIPYVMGVEVAWFEENPGVKRPISTTVTPALAMVQILTISPWI